MSLSYTFSGVSLLVWKYATLAVFRFTPAIRISYLFYSGCHFRNGILFLFISTAVRLLWRSTKRLRTRWQACKVKAADALAIGRMTTIAYCWCCVCMQCANSDTPRSVTLYRPEKFSVVAAVGRCLSQALLLGIVYWKYNFYLPQLIAVIICIAIGGHKYSCIGIFQPDSD